MGNIFKSDFVFLGLVIIASLLFVSGLGSSAIMGLLGYSGLSLAEVMARTELNASRAILAQQGLGSLAIFLIPGVAMLQRWAYVSYFALCAPGDEDATFLRLSRLVAASVPEFQLAAGDPGRPSSP